MNDFWSRVTEKIKQSGKTQEYVASKIPVRPDVFSRWIQKGTFPKADQITTIAIETNSSVEYFVTGNKGGTDLYVAEPSKPYGVSKSPQHYRTIELSKLLEPAELAPINQMMENMIKAKGQVVPEEKQA